MPRQVHKVQENPHTSVWTKLLSLEGLLLSVLLLAVPVKAQPAFDAPHTDNRSANSRHSDSKVKIGMLGSLEGADRGSSQAAQYAIAMAQRELGAQAPTLVFVDDHDRKELALTWLDKLSRDDSVQIIISVGDQRAQWIAEETEKRGLPLIVWAADESVSRGRPLVIRTALGAIDEGMMLAGEALQRGIPSFAWFADRSPYAQAVLSGMTKKLPADYSVVVQQSVTDHTDFRKQLLEVKQLGIKTIGLCLPALQAGKLALQARELEMKLSFFGCSLLSQRQAFFSSQDTLLGAWFAAIDVSDQFRERFVKLHGLSDFVDVAALHYDLTRLLAVHWKAGAPAADNIHALLSRGRYHGALGEFTVVENQELNERAVKMRVSIREIVVTGSRKVSEPRATR